MSDENEQTRAVLVARLAILRTAVEEIIAINEPHWPSTILARKALAEADKLEAPYVPRG